MTHQESKKMDTSADEVQPLRDINKTGVPEICAELAKIGCCPRCVMRILNLRSFRAFEVDNKVRVVARELCFQ
jgi:hypothetical protein